MKHCEAVPISALFHGPDEVVSSTVEALDGLALETKEQTWTGMETCTILYKSNKVYFVNESTYQCCQNFHDHQIPQIHQIYSHGGWYVSSITSVQAFPLLLPILSPSGQSRAMWSPHQVHQNCKMTTNCSQTPGCVFPKVVERHRTSNSCLASTLPALHWPLHGKNHAFKLHKSLQIVRVQLKHWEII